MKTLTDLAGVVLLAVIQALSPLQVKAHELSDEDRVSESEADHAGTQPPGL